MVINFFSQWGLETNLKSSEIRKVTYSLSFLNLPFSIILGYLGKGFPNSPKEPLSFIELNTYTSNYFYIRTSCDLTYYNSIMNIFYISYGV